MKNAEKRKLFYDVISHDITSNCNIRCKFCFNRWDEMGPNENMTVQTFEKVMELLPLAHDEGFYFSCLYEPLINKDICALLDCIPAEHRNKCFFTTNLVTHLSDDVIHFLSNSNLHHINISLESLTPDTYHEVCEHGKFDVYYDNLQRLVGAFKKAENPPKLRYITMILKENYKEIPAIAKRCHEEFLSDLNEFRTPFVGPHMHLKWLDNQILDRSELDRLTKTLEDLSIPIVCSTETSTDNYNSIIDEKAVLELESEEKAVVRANTPETNSRYYHLRIDSDGIVTVYGTGEKFNINEIDKPYEFFLEKLRQLYLKQVESFIQDEAIDLSIVDSSEPGTMVIDQFTDTDGVVQINGWSILHNFDMGQYEKLVLLESEKGKKTYLTKEISRPDVARAYNDERFLESGFSVSFSKADIGEKFTLSVIFKAKSNTTWYCKEYEDELVF